MAGNLNRYVPDWSVTSNPGANAQASASRPASTNPSTDACRHVCTSITALIRGGTTAPAAVQVTVNLRDGASGAGTILASFSLVLAGAIAAADSVFIDTLEIIGSPNTAMTLEFTAAGGANTFESVTMTGHTIWGPNA